MVAKKWVYTDSFLDNYKTKQPPWGPLGFIVYRRTYSRWIASENRYEQWWETVRRVLEGNYNLKPDDPTISTEDMEQAFDDMFHMRWLPAGRGLWISGTQTASRVGASLVNCWAVPVAPDSYYPFGVDASPIKASTPFVFAADRLMLGGGLGYDVTKETVAKFSKVRSKVDLTIVCDPRHPNIRELDADFIPPRDRDHTYIRVADSRRGWTDALRVVVDASFKKTNYDYQLIIDVSDVRASGKRIKGFGGTSSGPAPLVRMLRAINRILNEAVGRKITTLEAMDIMGNVAKCVVSGNVRRSATLAMGSSDDMDFIEAKLDADKLKDVRWTANISIAIDDAFEAYERIVSSLAVNGEPGIINVERSKNYGRFIDGLQEGIDSKVSTTNPCGEITLEPYEPCNLVDVFPYFCSLDKRDVEDVVRIACRYAKRVTFAPYDWESTVEVINRNRRIGVGISGWEDMKMLLGTGEESKEQRTEFLDRLYQTVKAEDEVWSEANDANTSIKLTTIKPSGTISNLRGASPGRHAHYAPFYIRRVRLSQNDPLLNVVRDANFPIVPDAYSPNTFVVEIPVKAPTAHLEGFRSAADYSLREQMEDQMELQMYWADNSVSSTLTFKKDEVSQIADLLREFKFKSTSLLPYDDHGYEQPPFEPISEEEYNSRVDSVKFWPSEEYMDKDKRDMDIIDIDDCAGGACPIR